jgi:hypothetical protein
MPREPNIQTVIATRLPRDGRRWARRDKPVTRARDPERRFSAEVRREEQEMIRKHFRFKRLVLGLAFGLVFAALVAPTAMAKPVNSNVLNGGLDPWAVSVVYNSTHPTQSADLGPLDPWAVNLVYKAAHEGTQSTPKAVDLGPLDPWAYNLVFESRNIGSATVGDTAIRVPNPSSGFDFADAGIGAAVTFGAAMILVASIGLGVRQRRIHRSGLATS